ncbi:hypothetical protein F4703DRAFT_1861563 [Phycomyces blakesleeanus]
MRFMVSSAVLATEHLLSFFLSIIVIINKTHTYIYWIKEVYTNSFEPRNWNFILCVYIFYLFSFWIHCPHTAHLTFVLWLNVRL